MKSMGKQILGLTVALALTAGFVVPGISQAAEQETAPVQQEILTSDTADETAKTASNGAEKTVQQPIKLARMPLMIRSYYRPDSREESQIELPLDRALHVPLNGILKRVDYLDEDKCIDAFDEVVGNVGGKQKMENYMRPLAEKLDADLVVLPTLEDYYQEIYYGWGWHNETYMYSRAEVKLFIYDRRTDKMKVKSISRFFHDTYMPSGEAVNLAVDAMDTVIRETNLRTYIWPSKEQKEK